MVASIQFNPANDMKGVGRGGIKNKDPVAYKRPKQNANIAENMSERNHVRDNANDWRYACYV